MVHFVFATENVYRQLFMFSTLPHSYECTENTFMCLRLRSLLPSKILEKSTDNIQEQNFEHKAQQLVAILIELIVK